MATLPLRHSDDDSSQDQRLHELIAAYLEAKESGQGFDREALLKAEPELAQELAEFFANEDHLARIAEPLRQCADPNQEDTGVIPEIYPHPLVGMPPAASRTSRAVSQEVPYFGDYELLDVIAQGGMGIVYRARQVSLNRILALKMIRAGKLAQAEDLIRFRLEAAAAAHLDHPQIVPIYEVGEHDGHHYFSMKLIEGGNLAERAGRFRGRPAAAARLLILIARGVHYAHQRGILHRDLKPANILLSGGPDEPVDRLIPLITDFGLAKRVEAEPGDSLTASGSLLGSPGYMAPEQADGRREAITTAVDIHALGTILYELLCGRAPFRGDSVLETLRQIREQEPVSPRSIDARIPHDLQTIVLKCLEKSPARRYASAEALADDLERWRAGLPILARSSTPAERLLKWVRRRPAIAALVAIGTVAAVASAIAIRASLSVNQLQADVDRADLALIDLGQKREAAEAQLEEMEDSTYFKQLIAAEEAWRNNEPILADEILSRCPTRLRGWEWRHLSRRFHSELQVLQGHDGVRCGVAFRPGLNQFMCATETSGVILWNAVESRQEGRLPVHDGLVYGIAFDRLGTRMASAEASGLVRVWSMADGKRLGVLKGHQGWAGSVVFSQDGQMLASAGEDGLIRIWSVAAEPLTDAKPLRVLKGHEGAVNGLGFREDGRLLASAGEDGTVRLWDLQDSSDRSGRILHQHQQAVRCVAFQPGKNVLAASGADRTVRLWDLGDGHEIRRFGEFGNRVDGLAFTSDGRKLATAGLDHSVKIWDVSSGRQIVSFPGHAAPVFSVSFSSDDTLLASASQDSVVKVWDVNSEPGVRLLSLNAAGEESGSPTSRWVGGVAFHPGGYEIVAGGSDQTLGVWNLEAGSSRSVSPRGEPFGSITSVRYRPDGKVLATAESDRKIHFRDASTFEEVFTIEDDPNGFVSLAFSPDGSILATGGGNPPEIVQRPLGKSPPTESSSIPLRLWNAKTGAPLRSLNGHLGSIYATTFSPDGTRLISAGADGRIRVWDVGREMLVHELESRQRAILSVAVSPDGKILATSGAEGLIQTWDLAEGKLLRTLAKQTNWIFGLAFHPDGTRLASAGGDQTVRIWNPRDGREILTLRGHHDRVHGLAFSPDGSQLASASADGVVRIWETSSSHSLPAIETPSPLGR